MKIYTVKDTPADFFLPPFFARTDGQAQRMFVGSMGDSFPHRADFGLYVIGHFNEDTGNLVADTPEQILAGNSIPAHLDPRVPAVPPAQILDPAANSAAIQSNGQPS